MMTSVEGVYREGRVELDEKPGSAANGGRVIVTFLSNDANLHGAGISQEQAAKLRWRLASFDAEWSSPEMDCYDDYDAYKGGRGLPHSKTFGGPCV